MTKLLELKDKYARLFANYDMSVGKYYLGIPPDILPHYKSEQ